MKHNRNLVRWTGCMMAVVMAAGSFASLMAYAAGADTSYVKAQAWHESEEGDIDVEDALGNTYVSAYYGLWTRTYAQGQKIDRETKEVIEPGIEKEYTFYTPETYEAAGSCVYVLVPDGYTAEEFANDSSWMQVAYDNGFRGILETG